MKAYLSLVGRFVALELQELQWSLQSNIENKNKFPEAKLKSAVLPEDPPPEKHLYKFS